MLNSLLLIVSVAFYFAIKTTAYFFKLSSCVFCNCRHWVVGYRRYIIWRGHWLVTAFHTLRVNILALMSVTEWTLV